MHPCKHNPAQRNASNLKKDVDELCIFKAAPFFMGMQTKNVFLVECLIMDTQNGAF